MYNHAEPQSAQREYTEILFMTSGFFLMVRYVDKKKSAKENQRTQPLCVLKYICFLTQVISCNSSREYSRMYARQSRGST